ncbi:MAG: hypothetical protein RIC89_06890 [Pseudomonadales bacterium]
MFDKYQKNAVNAWYRDAQLGKTKYIWVKGVFTWGLIMFIILTFVQPLIQGQPLFDLQRILVGIVVLGIGGYLFGWFVWHSNSKKYGMEPTKENDQIE